MTKLGDICKFQSGGTPAKGEAAYYGGKIPWITTVALNGGMIGNESAIEWITQKALHESAAKLVPAFSIMIGTRVGVGKVAINCEAMSTSQDIISLIGINDARWSKPYICRFLQAKSDFLNAQARGATIKGIKIEVLSELDIPEITLVEQRRIADIFDKISMLIIKKQEQLRQMELLVKSRFVEMFGEPLKNAKGWIEAPLIEVAPIRQLHGLLQDEVWLLNLDAIESQTGVILFKQRVPVSEINASTVYFTVDSVLYSKLRPYLNKVVTPDENGIATSELLPMYPIPNKLNRAYLCHWLRSDAFVKHISEKVAGAKMPRVAMDYFRTLSIELPPLELQNRFAVFVSEVDKSKLAVKQSLEKLETLKKSLMQKYFG